uniref:EF-hand domain-containing protein n=1 Tax=Echinostoma caproni TaxID=27848 RepID=A0A183ASN2_9TREM
LEKVLLKVCKFTEKNGEKKVSREELVNGLSDVIDAEELDVVFILFDRDQDGLLDRKDLLDWLTTEFEERHLKGKIRERMDRLSVDENGLVTSEQFFGAYQDVLTQKEVDYISEIFNLTESSYFDIKQVECWAAEESVE